MDSHFERELAKRLRQLIDDKTSDLTQTVLTKKRYHLQMGYLLCLREIEVLCDEIRKDLRQ